MVSLLPLLQKVGQICQYKLPKNSSCSPVICSFKEDMFTRQNIDIVGVLRQLPRDAMNSEELTTIATLMRSQRVAALGTLREDSPFVSMVAYAAEPDFGGLLVHLSQLAAHTKQLLAAPRSSLLIGERDDDRDD